MHVNLYLWSTFAANTSFRWQSLNSHGFINRKLEKLDFLVCDFISFQVMAFLSVTFYTLAVLLLSERTQARPGRPQFPSSSVGCDVPGDKLYPLGAVIFKDPNGCHEFICTKHGIQISDGDCATPDTPSTPPGPPTDWSASPTNSPPPPSTTTPELSTATYTFFQQPCQWPWQDHFRRGTHDISKMCFAFSLK